MIPSVNYPLLNMLLHYTHAFAQVVRGGYYTLSGFVQNRKSLVTLKMKRCQ